MGGKSGGGQSAPYEAPNTLSSAQLLRVVDLICEGPIRGFANGQDAPFKSVYLNDTPIQNSDGSYNFSGVAGFFQRGLPDQAYVPGFDVSERTVAVSVQVKRLRRRCARCPILWWAACALRWASSATRARRTTAMCGRRTR